MAVVRRLLLTTLLVMLLIGSATAQDAPSNTLSCSLALPAYAGCFYERVGFSLFGLEVGTGLDVRMYPDPYFAPFIVVGYYAESYSVVMEAFMPDIAPVIGRPGTVFSVTTTYRW